MTVKIKGPFEKGNSSSSTEPFVRVNLSTAIPNSVSLSVGVYKSVKQKGEH